MPRVEVKTYKARVGARFDDEVAAILGAYKDERALNTPQAIYQDAKQNEDSPFRRFLEWDNDAAAERFRVEQIKEIVSHISVEVTYVGGGVVRFDRAYEFVTLDSSRQYIAIEDGLGNPETREQIISRAKANLKGWEDRYGQYEEFAGVVVEINKLDF